MKKIKFKLNLFDTIVILVALVAAAVLFYISSRPAPDVSPDYSKVQYTVRLNQLTESNASRIEPGDKIIDSIKNLDIGRITNVEIKPSTFSTVNQAKHAYELVNYPGRVDVYITIESNATTSDREITLDSGFVVRVGQTIYARGESYVGIGPCVSLQILDKEAAQ